MVRFNDHEAGDQIAQLAGCAYLPGYDVCFSSHREDGEFLGGVILTGYTGAAMMIHIGSVSERWVSRDLLWVTFHYPFVQLNCRSLIATIPDTNTSAKAFATHIGLELETAIMDCLPNRGNMLVMRMWRERCKWLHIQPRTLRCRRSLAWSPGHEK